MKKHVVICIPTYTGQVHVGTMRAVMVDTIKMMGLGWTVEIIDDIGSADIYDIRARAVQRFIDKHPKGTHLFFVDADVQWMPGAIPRLVDHGVDFVAALYPQRRDPVAYALQYVDDRQIMTADPKTGLIEMAAVSAGFICLTRKMLERMIAHYKDDPVAGKYVGPEGEAYALWDPYRMPGTLRKFGEDYSFCLRWRTIGGKVWIDPDIPMAHTGIKVFASNFMDWLKLQEQPTSQEKAA